MILALLLSVKKLISITLRFSDLYKTIHFVLVCAPLLKIEIYFLLE